MSVTTHSDVAGTDVQNAAAVLNSLQQAVTALNDNLPHDDLVDLSLTVSENPKTLQADLDEATPDTLTTSHVTRTMTVLNKALHLTDVLRRSVIDTLVAAATECANVIISNDLHACESGNCNRAAHGTDLTPGWDGTGKEIHVCEECDRGQQQDDMPVRERDYHTDPSDPDVEGVDEMAAYQQDGMAGVAFVRQSREAWRKDMQ